MSKKLLLADDSVTIQKVVGLVFANGEYDLQCVGNGDAAFEKISFEPPDIVLADINMPGKNGFELCSAIKNNPASSKVPVLLLVGAFEPFDEDQARSAGADGWIVKPFESQDLIGEVEGLLSRPAETVSWPEPGEAAVAAEPDTWADMELDNLGAETAGDAAALDGTFGAEPEAGGVELEEENLWQEDQPVAEEPQPENASATVEEVLGAEEDILFIDEDDLLGDEPEQMAVSGPAELETPVPEFEVSAAELDPFALQTEPPTTAPDAFDTEPEAPAEDSLPSEPAMEILPEPAEEPAPAEVQPAAETPFQPAPERAGLDFWRNESLIDRLAVATAPESQASDMASAAEPVEAVASDVEEAVASATHETSFAVAEPAEEVVLDVEESVAPAMPESGGPCEEEATVRVQALSEEELGRIVERVAGSVIERLAGSILERIAWEVVPDLAEGLIKEEIRKITETSH